jgi:uncharacterized tellurite resistance protein B-like protein
MNEFLSISPTFYGMSIVPQKYWKDYGLALLTIAGADGDVSDPELDWLTEELGVVLSVPEETIVAWEEFEWANADLAEIFQRLNPNQIANYSKLILYDAIRMSYADGDYSDKERESVEDCARILRVSKETVLALEALVELERAADKLRQTLL